MSHIKVYTKKLREVGNAIKRFFSDFRPLWKDQGEIVKKAVQKTIDEGDSNWQRLSESTLKWRKLKGYPSGPILKAHEDLFKSIGVYQRPTKRYLEIGTEIPYAAVQQFGSKDMSRHGAIPARPFMQDTEEMRNDLQADISEKLSREISKTIQGTVEDI